MNRLFQYAGILGNCNELFFFRRDALKEQFGKEPNRVSCLAVKSALLGTRHPRKEKEAALQTVTGKPACLDGKILMSTQSEKEPSVKICKIEVRKSGAQIFLEIIRSWSSCILVPGLVRAAWQCSPGVLRGKPGDL